MIRQKQIGRIANAVIEEYLQAGTRPSIRAVLAGVYKKLNGRVSGVPETVFSPISRYGPTKPDALNTLVAQIEDDLTNLYNESIDQTNRILRDYDFKITMREKLAQQIIDLIGRANLAQISNENVFEENFSSLENIQQVQTDAFIDFREYACYLPYASNKTRKADLTTAKVSYSTSDTTEFISGSVNNIVSDTLNQALFFRVSTPNNAGSAQITITLPGSGFLGTKLAVVPHLGGQAVISASLDSITLLPQTVDVSRRATWEFTPVQSSTITLNLFKASPDDTNGGFNFFDFGIRNVSLYYEEYVPEATLQSQEIDFSSQPFGSILLETDQSVPPNCDIRWQYEVNGGGLSEFYDISPGTPLVFNTISLIDNKRILPVRSTSSLARIHPVVNDITQFPNEGLSLEVLAPVRGGRTPLFALCRADQHATEFSVMKGRNAWKVTSYHYSTNVNGVSLNPPPSINDFLQPRGENPTIYVRYQPTEFDLNSQFPGVIGTPLVNALRLPAIEQPFQGLDDQVMHLFEANLIVNQQLDSNTISNLAATVLNLPNIFSVSGLGQARAVLYLNGNPLTVQSTNVGGTLSYSVILPLVPGSNTLQLVANNYYSLGGAYFDVGMAIFSQICAFGGPVMWYAEPGPQTQVAVFELQYQTARNDFSRYAVIPDLTTNENLIVVRELPTTQYDFFSYGNAATTPTKIVMQATLSGSPIQPSVTPKINSYRITMI